MKEPSITLQCELTIRLRSPDIPLKRTPQLFLIPPTHHQDLRSLPSHQAESFSPGLTTLTMKQVSGFNERKGLQAHILKLRQIGRASCRKRIAISVDDIALKNKKTDKV